MPDYSKGKIYKLWSPSKNLVYYGSTVQTLPQRLAKHKNGNNNNRKCTSSLILACEDYKMELIEEYSCNNKQQLYNKEGEYIKNNECVNKVINGRTRIEYAKEYRIKNREKRNEYNKQYIENNKEQNKEYHKQYRIDNKEQIKEYLEANKEKIAKQRKIRSELYKLKQKQEK
jgi:hypothetical protein